MSKNKIIVLLCVILVLVCCVTVFSKDSTDTVYSIPSNDVYITAAHISVDESRYKLLYVNSALDKAYYLDKQYLPTQIAENTEVSWYYGGHVYTGVVVESNNYFFYVKPDNPELVVNGMSGASVEDLGFISSYTSDGLLKGVYY